MPCRAGEDRPFTYSFDTVDFCTKSERNLNNPNPNANAITTKLRYDLGGSCSRSGDRLVMVVGTATDRFGASAELCNRKSQCPFVALSPMPDVEPAELIRGAQAQLKTNQITSLQAVDELTFAVQARRRQTKQRKNGPEKGSGSSSGEEFTQEEEEEELVTVLSMLADAADETLGEATPQTPRVQGSWPDTHAAS